MELTPQLRMLRPTLAELPPLALPEGFALRSYEPGDWAHWERILAGSFGGEPGRFSFDRMMRRDVAFLPERVLFVVSAETPVATASAWRVPGLMAGTGTVHYVGVVPEFQGHRLGYWVTLATLHRMVAEGFQRATLTTDDFRLPAVKTYLRLGFEPVLVHENQRQRWPKVFAELGMPEAGERFAAVLSGPVWQAPAHAQDDFDYGRMLVRRRRHQPDRPVGRPSFGECDALGDESLYHASELGRAGASVREVTAGSECPFAVWFEAGPAGLGPGWEVCLHVPGQTPLGTVPQHHDPQAPGWVDMRYPGVARLGFLPALREVQPPAPGQTRAFPARSPWMGFAVEAGRVAPGERVTLCFGARGGFRWTRLAGRQEIRVLVNPGRGEPVMRLPEPVVVRVLPGAAERVVVSLPGSAGMGETFAASLRLVDGFGNTARQDGTAALRLGGRTQTVPLRDGAAHGAGLGPIEGRALSCRARVRGLPVACSNRIAPVDEDGLRLFFGDLHVHDFTSHAEAWTHEVYRRARDEVRLDFVSVVPQAHAWLDNERWALHKHAAEAWLEEGRFVTFLGFEWQHSHYGDKVVHFLGGDQPYLSVDDPRYASPAGLYEALRGSDAVAVGHHPGYALDQHVPGTDWSAVEADVERLVELWPMHGSSEGVQVGDRPLCGPHRESGVMDALRRGLRLGFTAGSDTHSGWPGGCCQEPRPYPGGVCAIWASELSRRSLFAALRERRTYAVFGRRVGLRFSVNAAPMGSILPAAASAAVRVQAWAEVPIARVEVWRSAALWEVAEPKRTQADVRFGDAVTGPAFYHARVVLDDGSLAVCSPVWIGG